MSLELVKSIAESAMANDWRSCETREDAIQKGWILYAGEAGYLATPPFDWPVWLTLRVWDDSVSWTDQDDMVQVYQHRKGRLHDVVNSAAQAIARAREEGIRGSILKFTHARIPRDGRSRAQTRIDLVLWSHPGDRGEPVITIMMPEEARGLE